MSKIFGVDLLMESKREIFQKIDNFLGDSSRPRNFIVTLNQEILLKAKDDETYKKILNSADLKIIDSFGIILISKIKRLKVGKRVAGAEVAKYILKKSLQKKLKIGIIMKKGGFSNKKDFERFIKKKNYPKDNFKIFEIENLEETEKIKSGIIGKELDVLLVGLGAPEQEKLIARVFGDNEINLRVAIGVGGTFDFWTGKKKRAPKFLRKVGVEWLWRFAIQPNRIGRIWNATAVFLWQSLSKKGIRS